MRRLNLGSAGYKKNGYVNVDWQSIVEPDVAHDLNTFPYPFQDDEFDLVEADHVLEHLDRPFAVMRELHRILKPGGQLIIKVPHFSRGLTHAEHAHGFDVTFPLYFDRRFAKAGYFGVDFTLKRLELSWLAFFHLLPFMGYGGVTIALLRALNAVVSFLANLSPAFCSRVWCYWVGGFEQILFEFEAVKDGRSHSVATGANSLYMGSPL